MGSKKLIKEIYELFEDDEDVKIRSDDSTVSIYKYMYDYSVPNSCGHVAAISSIHPLEDLDINKVKEDWIEKLEERLHQTKTIIEEHCQGLNKIQREIFKYKN